MRGARDEFTDVITDNAKPERARRGDVLSGPERRRRWSVKEKLEIVAESFETGAVVSHVAQRHGIKPQQLFDWRRQVREHVPRSRPATAPAAPEAPAFTPVIVAEQAPALPPPASTRADPVPPALIEIAIGAATVRINGPVDAKALTAVLRAVSAIGSPGSGRTP